jgi:hypothetical protein
MRKSVRTWGATALTAVAIGSMFSTSTASAAPGNDGVIKLDDVPFDQHTNNEPHVGCLFELDFYGYDQGSYNARVTFTVPPPTGRDIVLRRDRVFIGEDPAGGGTDLDAERDYNLTAALREFMAHPQQGYHIKVQVRAPGSIGADTKYKVFWVTGCAGY